MNRFTPRTEADRIQVAILECLEGLREDIKTLRQYNDEQIVTEEVVEQIIEEVKKPTKKKVK